jgi:hypothetical protein
MEELKLGTYLCTIYHDEEMLEAKPPFHKGTVHDDRIMQTDDDGRASLLACGAKRRSRSNHTILYMWLAHVQTVQV